MAKKSSQKYVQPNAPQLEHLLYQQQPAQNPYYPNISTSSTANYPSPPAYSDHNNHRPAHVPLTSLSNTNNNHHQMGTTHQIIYPSAMSDHVPSNVVVTRAATTSNHYVDRRRDVYKRKVQKFGCELLMVAVLIFVFTQAAIHLYSRRHCPNYAIQKFNPDFTLYYNDLQEFNMLIRTFAAILFVLGLLRYSITNGCGCLVGFLIGCVALCGTIIAGYACYLSFYSPCFLGIEEVFKQFAKTISSAILDRTPGPERGFFGEKNIIQTVEKDPEGVYIFGLNLGIFIMFISTFFAGFN